MESHAAFLICSDDLVQIGPDIQYSRRGNRKPPRLPKTEDQLRQRRLGRMQRRNEDRLKRMEGQGFKCMYCGASFLTSLSAFIGATWDHVHPKSLGGPSHGNNMVLVCYTCNQLKRDTEVESKDEARKLVMRRQNCFRGWFNRALARASELRDKPSLLKRLVRRVRGVA